MATTTRISDIVPRLYYQKPNDLIKFVNALDLDVSSIERQIAGLTDLINIDKCPDDKLVYLAGLTGCNLIGTDPVFWRRQIKSWPYILKLKGTQRSLELVLNSIGAQSWNVKTYFRDANGDYVTKKPDGEPFLWHDGLWRNSRTHYFSIELTVSKEFVERGNYSWDVDEITEKLNFWINNGKPFHSELLYLTIYSPNLLPEDHICRWDVCTWEHGITRIYDWGMLTPEPSVFDENPVIKRIFLHKLFTIHDTAFWDFSTWGGVPVRNLLIGSCSENAIIANLEWGDGEYSTLFPNIWDSSKWDYTATFTRSIGSVLARDFELDFDLDEISQLYFAIAEHKILYDNRPNWDDATWLDHDKWVDDFAENISQVSSIHRDFSASLSIPLDYTWYTSLTWQHYDAWDNCKIKEQTIEPSWIIYAEDEANSNHDADFWIGISEVKHVIDASLDVGGLIQAEITHCIPYEYEGEDIFAEHSYIHNLEIYDYSEPAYLDINTWDNTRVSLSEISAEWLIRKDEEQDIINGVALWDVNNWDSIEY